MIDAMKEVEGQGSMKICRMTIEMVQEVSDVHMKAFKGSMNTRLGKTYINRFLDWFVRLEKGIVLVGIWKSPEGGQIIGYVVGAPLNYGKALNRDLFWIAACNAAIRPWLFFSRQFRENVKARLGSFWNPSQTPSSQFELPSPSMSLVGLAVLPSFQGQSLGKKLLKAFEEQARNLRIRSLRLSVYPENSAARCAYEKCGWLPCKSEQSPGKAMFYYKIL